MTKQITAYSEILEILKYMDKKQREREQSRSFCIY